MECRCACVSLYEVRGILYGIRRKGACLFDTIAIKSKDMRIEDTILVASTPRSGSTWVMELLGWLPHYTTLFEPLHPKWFPESYKVGFQSRTYIPPEERWGRGKKYLETAFSGKTISQSPYIRVEPHFLLHRVLSTKIVVKTIRANRLLPWIHNHLAVRSVVLVVRHPCATIASQLKSGYYGYNHLTPTFDEKRPHKEQLEKEVRELESDYPQFREKIKGLEYKEEILAAVWSLDTYIPLTSKYAKNWYIVPYEKLVAEGVDELQRLYDFVGEPVPNNAVKHLTIPSKVTQGDVQKVVKKDYQLRKWKENLKSDQIERIMKVAADFGLDFYTDSVEPDYKKLEFFCENLSE